MPTVSWKLPPQIHGDDSTTSANDNPLYPHSPMKKTLSDWNVRSEFDDSDDENPFDDDNSLGNDGDLTTQAENWEVPPPTPGESSIKKSATDWILSEFNEDDDNPTTPANNWKVPPSTHGGSSTEKTPTDWKERSAFDDDDDEDLTTPANKWKVPPSTHGDSSREKAPTDWKERSAFDDDDDEDLTTPANKWKVPPSTHGDSSREKAPTDWKERSAFDDDDDDDDLTTPANNWKVPPSTHGDSSTEKIPGHLKGRSAFDDDDDDDDSNTPANNWKIPPSTLGDTKKIPPDWKIRSSLDGYSKKLTTDNWKLPPLIEDDGSSRTTSADDLEVPPSVHDNDSITTFPTYTPYLKLPHLLSLAWMTYPVISLILVAFRLQLSLASVENGLDNLKSDLLASCSAAEKASSAAASLPRYLAQTANQQFVDAANGVMTGARSALILSLTILEGTLNFAIDMYRSTFLCLLELAVGVGFSLVSDAVQAVSTSVATVGNDLASQISSANSALTSAVNAINKIDPISKITPPTPISASDLSELQNLSLPSSFQSTLTSINSSIPSADQIKAAIQALADTPFELLKQAINNTFDNFTFDATIFPVPAEHQLSFCNNLDTSSIDSFKTDLVNIARYGTIIIIGLAGVITGLNCLLIWYRWRSKKRQLGRTRQALVSDPAVNLNGSSPSAPQVIPSDRNLMMSQASAPQGNNNLMMSQASAPQGDHNLMMSQASPYSPQVIPSDRNLMMSQASAPQGNLSDHKLMSQASPYAPQPQVIPSDRNSQVSAPQGNLSDHKLMSQASPYAPQPQVIPSDRNSQVSAPQGNLSDHKLMSQASPYAPQPQAIPSDRNSQVSAPQGNLSDHKFMSQVSPSTPQVTPSDPNLMMSQVSAPQGDHNLMMSQASALQGNLIDYLMMSQGASPSAPQFTLSDHNLMMLQTDSEHPLITRITYFLAARTGMTPAQHIDMRWFLHYVFHPPALACFLIGFFGLLSVMVQLLLLGPLLAEARAGVDIAISDLTNVIVDAINTTMYNQSASYANDVNSKVDVVQNAINDGLFGWVNGTTTLLNNTVNGFYTDIQNFVTHLFNGTILEDPALGFLQCIIGGKVADVEEALTFLTDNLAIDIPRLRDDVLVLSASAINEVTGPIASGAAGNGQSGDNGLLGDVVSLYEDSLKSEALIFGIFMGLWGVVLASGILILLWRIHKRKRKAPAAAAAAAAVEHQKVNSEVKVELKDMEENNFSFSSDEKNDPFIDS